MANKDLIKEYDEWKKKRDSRESNYDYDNGVSSDDLVGEYNSWKKNYEASQQRVKPAARLSQPSPLMQGALDMANPLSKNYVDPFAQKASYDWYSQPQSKREQIVERYAQNAQNAAKYDGMSYADRAAALEQLKINLKNMPSPEQGAEYQYLKNNLAQASPFESAQYRADQDAARVQRISDAQGKSGEYNAMKSEFDRDYSSSDYYDLVRRREDAQARGRTDLVKEINDQIDKYRRGRLGTREAELIEYLETHSPQDFNVDEDVARHNSYQRYQSGADNALLSLTTAHDEADLYALALKGAQGSYVTNTEKREAKGADYTERSRSAGTRRRGTHTDEYAYGSHGPKIVTSETSRTFDDAGDAQTNVANFEELAKHLGEESGLNQLRGNYPAVYAQIKDTLEAYVPADPTDPIDLDRGVTTFSNYVEEGEWLRFYALLGEGGEQNEQAAAEYMNALKPALAARAEQAKQQMYRDTLKNAPPVLDVALGAAYTGKSIISGIASAPVAFGDELIQYATKGEYDPYTPWNATKINADLLGGATSQAISEDHNGADAFLFNAIKSAIESTAGALAFGKAFTFIMGTSAGASRARELYKEGASQDQILLGSLTAAVNEAAFEYISLDKLLKADPKTLKQYVKQIFVQAGIEGSEEISTDVANTISDALILGENSDYNRDIQRMLYENPEMSYEEARNNAATKVITDALESGLAGAISGGASFAGYVAPTLAGNVARRAAYSSQNNKIGKNITSNYQAENTVKQGLEADENSEAYKLAKEIDERQRDGKTVSNKALGELARALDTELTEKSGNALEKASEYRREAAAAETVENALKENGATDEEAADLAPLVSKSILGEELTDAEQAKIDNNTAAVRYMDEVGSKTSEISGETGLQQLALRVNATTRGTGSTKASDRLREGALDKVFETAMRNELKPAKLSDNEINKANETSYKVSTTGKTTYNGKAVNIDAISEIGDGNALVTLVGGETAKLSEIEFADKGEAVAWQTITSIDGITPQAASSLIAQYKNKPANVTAGVWARGIAEGYEIGRSGKLGTKEFPKAEASAKYLSNIGNDARRISETVGRQDARYEQHKEAIEVDRKNVNNKNVNDAADTLDNMGRKYKIVEGIDGDGYIEKDGTIVLNKDAKDPIGFVLKHELTHYAETSKDYDGFVKAVKGSKAFAAWIDKQSLKDGTQLQQEADYLRRLKDRYRRHGVTLTNTEAHREMIANFVGDTLFNENGVGLDGLVNGMNAADRNAVMRFLTKIADFFRKHFTKKGETAYLEHFFGQLQNTATGKRTDEKTYSIAETENDEKYLAAVNSGDMETAQRMVDEAAKAAGYTYHLYHGTKAKFNKFDPRKFGGSNGKGEGYGIYLASNKEISAPYGDNLIDSYVKFERLAEGTRQTLKTAEVRNIIKASCEAEARQSVEDGEYDSLADALKDSWVSNYVYTYDYQGMNQVYTDVADKILKSNDNDGDIINEIMIASGAHYNYSAALDFYDNILTPITGIDGFHYVWGKGTDNANDIYLAFRSEQIKRSDPVTYDDNGNVIPLSERFNEGNDDIRWSIPETAERERAQSIKQIERLNETVTHLRDMLKLQRTLTHGTVMTQASVARQADRLMDRWDVYVGKGELTKLLNTFYTTVAQKVNQRELTWEEVADAAQPVVDYLLSKQVTETVNDSVKNVVDYLKGKAIRLNDIQRAEIKHVYGSITAWQKAIAGTVKLRNDGMALDSLWQEASDLYGDWFDPDVTSDADMPIRLAETAKQLQDSLWMEQELPGEAWEETKRDILYDVYETFFDAAPIQTLADKQAKEMSELKAKAYAKIEQVKDAASTRIQNLKEADRERYERLRRDKNAKIEEVKAEARERRQRERERRKKSQLRAEIKDRISEFNDKLLRPGKNKYVPMEFVRSVAGFLKDIDIGAKPGTKVSEKLAALKVKYEALKNDKYYSAAYNEQIGNLLQTVATEIGDTPLPKMSAYQLELLNNMLRALNHRIEHAVSVDRISKSKNAFEYARELIGELNAVDRRAITGTTAGKLLDMQVRPQTMFERFAGFKKNSYWSQLYDALDSAQLRETQLSMEAQQMFSDLLNDRKNYKRLAESVDIGLTDGEGNPVLISRGMMLSIRRALMNADNTRHIVGGGFTIPDFDLYYKGKTGDAFNKKGKRVFGFAADMADIAHQIGELRETMAEQEIAGESTAETETKIADLESQFNELKDRSNAYAAQLAATIDDQLTMYEQNLLSMADVFFDEWSKDILNEATLAVYGFKKANVEKYFPIKVDNNYTETKFDTFSNDISLENAGFMKDRVMSSKPILLQDITDVISDQIKKVSRYAAYLEVLDDFKRIYNVTLPGSSDSVQDALGKRFAGEEGKKFIENLLQDIQGGRRGGSVTLFDKARGKLAAATLTLNARVALAQAASFPTAAAELGWAPIMKALGKTFKKTDKELIMKYSPLLAYRSWGFSSTEIGDARRIKDIRHKVDSKLRWLTGWITSVDSYTVGHLWYAAEYYVDANNKDLEKGSEKYYEEVAKVFNRTIEKTQPNYTTLQRPELMRTDNALVKQLSMFMTQRLQNVNILYEAFARYDKYKKDFKAGRNGVTREDVIEARKARTRAIESQIIAAATISIIKNLTDMLLHNFKKRDDDDDYDLTDAGWNLLDAFCDSLISNVVLGSEAYSFLKSKITGDRYYGISLGGVGAITETVDDVSDFIDATKKAFAGSDMNWNAAKQLGYSMSRLMGIPVQNAVKYVTAVSEWVQDAKADQFNHGNYVGKAGVRLYLAEGRTSEAIKEINEQQAKGVDMQSTIREYYKPMYLDAVKRGDTKTAEEIGKELNTIIKETGVYKNSADKVLSGWVQQAEKDDKEKNK